MSDDHDDELTPPITAIGPMVPTTELDGAYLKADVMALTGELAGRRFVLDREVVIGRDPSTTIQVPGNDVSRRHARVWKTESGDYVLEDLKSRNGTLVNGKPIEVHVLQFGDKFQVGSRTLFVFTHHQALEEQLVRWQRIELIAEMTAGLVHDFNNYMAALLGYIQYLEDFSTREIPKEQLLEILHSSLPVMKEAAFEGSNLARKVLTFARGTKRPYMPVDFGQVINKAVQLVTRIFEKSIAVKQQIQPDLRVTGEQTELLQVLINLMLNARDAMPKGGTLSIEAATEEIDESQAKELNMPVSDELVVIKVRDTGIGMDKETRKRIFEPLFTTKEKGKGTGLGLSMVARIVESHGGQIQAESNLGQGTLFTIYLPVVAEEEAVTSGDTLMLEAGIDSGPVEDEDRGMVLMMDVDEEMRQRAARVVYAMGYDFIFSRNPQETVELFDRYGDRIELVIINMDVPREMDSGSTISAELRAIDPSIRVLFTSSSEEDQKEKLPVKIRRILRLPCDSRTFKEALDDVLK